MQGVLVLAFMSSLALIVACAAQPANTVRQTDSTATTTNVVEEARARSWTPTPRERPDERTRDIFTGRFREALRTKESAGRVWNTTGET